MPQKVETGEFFRRILDARMLDVWTGFVARVESYDPVTRTADLAPVIRRPLPTEDGSTEYEDLVVISNVPIRFPMGGGGTYAITWRLQAGDFVDVHVLTLAHTEWRRTGEISNPGDLRTHSLGNCYATPGACPNSQALAQAQEMALVIEAPEIRLGSGATELVALASKVMTGLNKVKAAMTAAVIVAGDGGASLKSTFLSSLGSFADVAAEKVKAK